MVIIAAPLLYVAELFLSFRDGGLGFADRIFLCRRRGPKAGETGAEQLLRCGIERLAALTDLSLPVQALVTLQPKADPAYLFDDFIRGAPARSQEHDQRRP